jgi:hypothetical protein
MRFVEIASFDVCAVEFAYHEEVGMQKTLELQIFILGKVNDKSSSYPNSRTLLPNRHKFELVICVGRFCRTDVSDFAALAYSFPLFGHHLHIARFARITSHSSSRHLAPSFPLLFIR